MSERGSHGERRIGFFKGSAIIALSAFGIDKFVTDGLVAQAAVGVYQDISGMPTQDENISSNQIAYTEVNVTNPDSSWVANPHADEIINNLSIPENQKEYVRFAFNGAKYALENGAQTNPALMMVVPVIETGYGTDGLSKRANNHHGIKGSTEECGSVNSETFEEIDGQHIDIVDSFKCYDNTFGSFTDFDGLMKRLTHYSDVIPCSGDIVSATNALQHEVDPSTCEIIAYQQEISPVTGERVLGHATASGYVALVEDVADLIHAEELFVPA